MQQEPLKYKPMQRHGLVPLHAEILESLTGILAAVSGLGRAEFPNPIQTLCDAVGGTQLQSSSFRREICDALQDCGIFTSLRGVQITTNTLAGGKHGRGQINSGTTYHGSDRRHGKNSYPEIDLAVFEYLAHWAHSQDRLVPESVVVQTLEDQIRDANLNTYPLRASRRAVS